MTSLKVKIFAETENLEKENVIYGLVDPDTLQIRYIGKAKNLVIRITNHFKESKLKYITHKNNWIKFLLSSNKFPKIIILEKCTEESLNKCEIKWIKFYREQGANLTNGTDGGDGGRLVGNSLEKMRKSKTGTKLSSETRLKMSIAQKGRISGMAGKTHSCKTKALLSLIHTGRKFTDESRLKMSKAKKGKFVSEGAKINMSIAHKGKEFSQTTKDKMSKNMQGNKRKLGYKESEETKFKKSQALKTFYKTNSHHLKGKAWKIVNGKRVYLS